MPLVVCKSRLEEITLLRADVASFPTLFVPFTDGHLKLPYIIPEPRSVWINLEAGLHVRPRLTVISAHGFEKQAIIGLVVWIEGIASHCLCKVLLRFLLQIAHRTVRFWRPWMQRPNQASALGMISNVHSDKGIMQLHAYLVASAVLLPQSVAPQSYRAVWLERQGSQKQLNGR